MPFPHHLEKDPAPSYAAAAIHIRKERREHYPMIPYQLLEALATCYYDHRYVLPPPDIRSYTLKKR